MPGRCPTSIAKLVRAAARTHRATGLPIYSHTGNGIAALAQVAVLEDERAPLGAFVWVHAQNETDPAVHAQVARRGAWVSFDGVGAQSLERHLGLRAGDARGPAARSRAASRTTPAGITSASPTAAPIARTT